MELCFLPMIEMEKCEHLSPSEYRQFHHNLKHMQQGATRFDVFLAVLFGLLTLYALILCGVFTL